jgi:hypothetical protein
MAGTVGSLGSVSHGSEQSLSWQVAYVTQPCCHHSHLSDEDGDSMFL